MSKGKINPLQFLQNVLATFLIVFLCVSLFTACSSADATAKKEKSKKSKAKQDSSSEEETESVKESDKESEKESEDSEDKTADSHSDSDDESKDSEKKASKNKTADKKDAKPSEKESSKETKTEAEAIWADLMKGNKRFAAGKHTAVNYSALRTQLVKGQHPEVIVLGCSDSRVPPEFVFDKNLGELFVVRDAGNIADAVSLGSIEYAVEHLHSKVLLILGHESCGAVAATVSGEKMPTKNLRAIVDSIAPAFENSKTCKIGDKVNLSCVELNVKYSSEDVVLNSPIIKKAVEEGKLTVIRAVYKMETGSVVRLD